MVTLKYRMADVEVDTLFTCQADMSKASPKDLDKYLVDKAQEVIDRAQKAVGRRGSRVPSTEYRVPSTGLAW